MPNDSQNATYMGPVPITANEGLSRPQRPHDPQSNITTLPPIGPLFSSVHLPSANPQIFSPPYADIHNIDHGGQRYKPNLQLPVIAVGDSSQSSPNAHGSGGSSGAAHGTNMAEEGRNAAETTAVGAGAKRPPPPPLDTMRAYRACLNCRGRKSKCDLDINQGRPPCRRCQREARECVLGESHRGGRRVRKKPKLEDDQDPSTASGPMDSHQTSPNSHISPHTGEQSTLTPNFQPRYGEQQLDGQGFTWQQTTSSETTRSASEVDGSSTQKAADHNSLGSPAVRTPYSQPRHSLDASKPPERSALRDSIAGVDLQNPSDALEILAQVADRAEDVDSAGEQMQAPSERPSHHVRASSARTNSYLPGRDDHFHYKPCQDGMISPEMIAQLFTAYELNYHPFFPIAPRDVFDKSRLSWLSRTQPHLFSAILTVASKDDERVHPICYNHMQNIVSEIMAGSDAELEAVEALLLLSQWVSNRPQNSVTVGRGEEDRVAWMYVGTALRLGYFLGVDRAAFKPDSREDPQIYRRKRLVWTACYMLDRQVSVRVGKGFWSRGPGPLSGLKGSDFPSLIEQSPEGDNWGSVFQANMELTQIFSNVYDILYASKGHGWKEMLEGRYAKYLDDFRLSIRNWNDVWGSIQCSPRLKTSLLLTYDYLRLYVNAFAYQATISRALTLQRDNQNSSTRQAMPLINATATDARFIYEALDAAKSLLTTFTESVEPQTLRYMPSSYYLFIIYSAVFLYKARSTTTMTDEERTSVRRMINHTIDRLQRASTGAGHMGSRYARLLQLLWRKVPKSNNSSLATTNSGSNPPAQQQQNIPPPRNPHQAFPQPAGLVSLSPASFQHQQAQHAQLQQHYNASLIPQSQCQTPPQQQQPLNFNSPSTSSYPISQHQQQQQQQQQKILNNNTNTNNNRTFSWLDLGATWDFATHNSGGVSNSGSLGEVDMDDEHVLWDNGIGPLDMGLLMTDYDVLEGDNPNLIF